MGSTRAFSSSGSCPRRLSKGNGKALLLLRSQVLQGLVLLLGAAGCRSSHCQADARLVHIPTLSLSPAATPRRPQIQLRNSSCRVHAKRKGKPSQLNPNSELHPSNLLHQWQVNPKGCSITTAVLKTEQLLRLSQSEQLKGSKAAA